LKQNAARVAFFPDGYHEIDGVAMFARHFEAFAQSRKIPFLLVHAGVRDAIVRDGSVTRVELRRGPLQFPLDKAHRFDLLLARHFGKVSAILEEFRPQIVQITGPSDTGILGAMLARKHKATLAAFWQTNLPQYAGLRTAQALAKFPPAVSKNLAHTAERWSSAIATQFYKIPQMIFAPNPEIMAMLAAATGKPCLRMEHGVDLEKFSPQHRDRQAGPFTIGYVGRLSAEKNIRWLATLEARLLQAGHRDFRIVVVGQGAEAAWLQANMRHVELCGVLTGQDLSRAYANLDVLAFPSETDTFGLAVLEALASGVPAVVTASGGPKFTVQAGVTGYVVRDVEEFSAAVASLMDQPGRLQAMRESARAYAKAHAWEYVFESVYDAYDRQGFASSFPSKN
jgi:phosphatidylinositol alpha 1,6-mannosyltransferase